MILNMMLEVVMTATVGVVSLDVASQVKMLVLPLSKTTFYVCMTELKCQLAMIMLAKKKICMELRQPKYHFWGRNMSRCATKAIFPQKKFRFC